jgi:hypothetical protein
MFHCSADQPVDINGGSIIFIHLGKAEELGCNFRAFVKTADNFNDMPVKRIRRLYAVHHQGCPALDGGQKVVEIMGYAPGKSLHGTGGFVLELNMFHVMPYLKALLMANFLKQY